MASYGFYAAVRAGMTYRRVFHHTRPATEDSSNRRFQQWVQDGTLRRVLEALAADLKERGDLDLSECFIDGTFVVAKKGAGVGKTKRAQRAPEGSKLMAVADGAGLPLAVHTTSAAPHEVTLV